MPLRLYNTRTRTVEPFVPRDPHHVKIYVCGLTPSAEAHLGHARSFLLFDVLRRYLVFRGLRVTYVQNVTDIDDRSIASAKEQGIAWDELVERHYASFKASMNALGVLEPDEEPRATKFIPEIAAMIEQLIERELAYVTADGVYYSVKKFPGYGHLSGRHIDELLAGARVAVDEDKRDPLDFALWKFAKPDEPAWPSPWGDGRPGWHIECSAMSRALLGEPLDIHGGGVDLVFPHHENEVAQSEPLSGVPLANCWVHGGLLQFDGKKMSKSLGNFEPLTQVVRRHDPQALRLLFLTTGYRKPMNFTEDSVAGATAGLRRLQSGYDLLRSVKPHDAARAHSPVEEALHTYRQAFFDALDDDLNTARAVAVLFEIAARAPAVTDPDLAAALAAFVHEALDLLGISPAARSATAGPSLPSGIADRLRDHLGTEVALNGDGAEAAVEAVIAARAEAKRNRDFARADRLRKILADEGVELRDTSDGTSWSVAR